MLRLIIRDHWQKLLAGYGLTGAGNAAELLYPFCTGLAINGVLVGNYWAVGWLVACHFAQMILTVSSKMIDTRIFTGIYADFASGVVDRAHQAGVAPSVVAARASLSRQYIEFFELIMPQVIYAAMAVIVSLAALLWFDWAIAAFCLTLVLPVIAVSIWLGRRSEKLNKGLNDRLEKEVELLRDGKSQTVNRHFQALSGWRIKLSDAEARAFGMMELLVILLFIATLWRVGESGDWQAGDIFAIFSYIWRFVYSLDQVPQLVQKLATINDLDRRFGDDSEA
jgi:ABC-type multidrug transport system fused ATPase/permease subunit